MGLYGVVIDADAHRKNRNYQTDEFSGLLLYWHFRSLWAMTADSVKSADDECLLAIGGAVTISVRVVYLSRRVLVSGSPVGKDEFKTERNRFAAVPCLASFLPSGCYLSAAAGLHREKQRMTNKIVTTMLMMTMR